MRTWNSERQLLQERGDVRWGNNTVRYKFSCLAFILNILLHKHFPEMPLLSFPFHAKQQLIPSFSDLKLNKITTMGWWYLNHNCCFYLSFQSVLETSISPDPGQSLTDTVLANNAHPTSYSWVLPYLESIMATWKNGKRQKILKERMGLKAWSLPFWQFNDQKIKAA